MKEFKMNLLQRYLLFIVFFIILMLIFLNLLQIFPKNYN